MAMPSGNVVLHGEKMQFAEDGFLLWLRSEFAAANAIIDSLCHHLRVVAEPGEYDFVINCIQQRRCNWNSVLHLQQYFSIGEVMLALQQVAWRRQQRYMDHQVNRSKRSSYVKKEVHNLSVDNHGFDSNSSALDAKSGEDKKDAAVKTHEDGNLKGLWNSETNKVGNLEPKFEALDDGSASSPKENDLHCVQNQNEKQDLTTAPKIFDGLEVLDGKMVNVVDGLTLYEDACGNLEVSKLVLMVNDLREAGKRGQIQGQAYVVSKRPMKGRGREMIQLGLPVVDLPPEDGNAAGTSKDRRIEPVPSLLQDVIERLVSSQIITVKPDSCVIDVFNEGDHSQPHMWPPWFGRPVCILFLTECDMTFGRIIGVDHPGDYRGALRLSLAPGSLLVMQGKSADFAKHAISSIQKQRILVTFTKCQPRKLTPIDGQRFPSSAVSPLAHRGPPLSRSPNHIHHPTVPKHFAPIPTTAVLPTPPIRAEIPPPNGVQPLFVNAPVAQTMPFPAPVPIPPGSTGWTTAPPRLTPRLPVPGTGVFLPPPGSCCSSSQLVSVNATETLPTKTEKANGLGKSNHHPVTSVKEKLDDKTQRQGCNGSVDGTGSVKAVTKEEEDQSGDNTMANKIS